MDGAHLLHFGLLAAWGGLVLGELVVEWVGRLSGRLRAPVAEFHYWIDVIAEIPLLAGVLLSGGAMLHRAPMDTLFAIKLAAGLLALSANSICVVWVLRRARLVRGGMSADGPEVLRLTRLIFGTAYVGVPSALVALWIGGARAGWW